MVAGPCCDAGTIDISQSNAIIMQCLAGLRLEDISFLKQYGLMLTDNLCPILGYDDRWILRSEPIAYLLVNTVLKEIRPPVAIHRT